MKRIYVFTLLLPLLAGCIGKDNSLHTAAACGDLQKVEALFENGENINAGGMYGCTPLYCAALQGQNEVVSYLLAKGADPNIGAGWKGNDTPLHVAARNGNLACVQLLLSHGVPVDIQNGTKQTPLFLAAEFLHPDVVAGLLDHGANANATAKGGATPLTYSTCFGEGYATNYQAGVAVVQILLEHGANPNVKGMRGTPLAWATSGNHNEIAKLLREHGAKE